MRKVLAVIMVLALATLVWAGSVFALPTIETARDNAQTHSERQSVDTSHKAALSTDIRRLRAEFLTGLGAVEDSTLTTQARQQVRNTEWLVDSLREHGEGYRSRRTTLHTGLGTADKALVTVEEYSLSRAEEAVAEGMEWTQPWQARGGRIGVYATWHEDKIYCVSIISR